jgi:hypothetical protein
MSLCSGTTRFEFTTTCRLVDKIFLIWTEVRQSAIYAHAYGAKHHTPDTFWKKRERRKTNLPNQDSSIESNVYKCFTLVASLIVEWWITDDLCSYAKKD